MGGRGWIWSPGIPVTTYPTFGLLHLQVLSRSQVTWVVNVHADTAIMLKVYALLHSPFYLHEG
jgi:hypothetical protein